MRNGITRETHWVIEFATAVYSPGAVLLALGDELDCRFVEIEAI